MHTMAIKRQTCTDDAPIENIHPSFDKTVRPPAVD